MTVQPVNDDLSQILAHWDDYVPCKMLTKSGKACRRRAQWVINRHGCVQYTGCSHHYFAEVRAMTAQARREGGGTCGVCRRVDKTWLDAHTAVRL